MTHPPHSTELLDPLDIEVAAAIIEALSPLSAEQRGRTLAATKILFGFDEDTTTKTERVTAEQAISILGLRPRKLQLMSQRGEIPGAAKLGRQWTYDLAKLRRFVEQQEKVTTWRKGARPPPDATGGEIHSGPALRSVGKGSGGRLRQMIRQSQRRAAKQAKTER
jgi:hypothetical protein